MPKVIEEAWTINHADVASFGAAGATTYRKDGTADTWSDIWRYQVPTGTAHILKPSHHFSAYIDAASEVGAGLCRLKIEVRDQSEGDTKTIFGPTLYEACKEFQDRDKMATLDLQSDFSVEEKMWVVIMAYCVGVAHDESACKFKLETIRIRSGV